MPACARAAIACARRSGTRGSTSPSIGSLSISRPATCARPAPRSTCRSRSACSPPPASSRARDFAGIVHVGELSLDGAIQPARGVLPIAAEARRSGAKALLLPYDNLAEAAVVSGLRLLPVRTLREAVERLNQSDAEWPPARSAPGRPVAPSARRARRRTRRRTCDLSDLHGQAFARRALEVAAAGGHNLLMIGPPGAGKTMLARRLPGILPPLSFEESIEVTTIHSVAGQLRPGVGLLTERPFRAPHHTISDVALVGGGSTPRPGEVSLAHHGVLFLDEMPEFDRRVLEALRQPIEEGRITVSRALRSVAFPARFVLVAAMNPCPCGYHGDPQTRLPLHAAADRALSQSPVGAVARSPRSDRRSGGGADLAADRRTAGRTVIRRARARAGRARTSARASHPRARQRDPHRHRAQEVRAARCRRAGGCSNDRRSDCTCPRARFIASFASRARSPISPAPMRSRSITSARRCSTGSSKGVRDGVVAVARNRAAGAGCHASASVVGRWKRGQENCRQRAGSAWAKLFDMAIRLWP